MFTSAHYGTRPSHAEWQGKAYGLDGPCEVGGVRYPGLAEATGYGTVAGLAGANCRHRIHPYVPGITKLPDTDFATFEAKYHMSSDEYYEATQKQRAMERQIRATKRGIALGEGAEPKDPQQDPRPNDGGAGEGGKPKDPEPKEGAVNRSQYEADIRRRDKEIAELKRQLEEGGKASFTFTKVT